MVEEVRSNVVAEPKQSPSNGSHKKFIVNSIISKQDDSLADKNTSNK